MREYAEPDEVERLKIKSMIKQYLTPVMLKTRKLEQEIEQLKANQVQRDRQPTL